MPVYLCLLKRLQNGWETRSFDKLNFVTIAMSYGRNVETYDIQ